MRSPRIPRISNLILTSVLALTLVSCASKPTTTANQFQLRQYTEETLPNGLRLIFIPDPSLPRISFQMMVKAGGLNESKDNAGLSSLVFGVLDQGSNKRKALELADAFAQIGSEFSSQSAADVSMVSASGLSTTRSELLKLFHEVVTDPRFESSEVERRKAQHLAALQKALDQPQSYADQIYEEALFESHPYARHSLGTKESLKAIGRNDLVKFYQTWVQPQNSILAVVGMIDEAFVKEVRQVMGQWKAKAPLGSEPARPTVSEGPLFKLVTKKGLQQTQIRMGQLGLRRKDDDFMKMRMAALILGGAFASRLNQRVRDDLGLTYSISSGSDARLDRGTFEISTFTRNEKAADTIRESLQVVREFVASGATQRELDAAKALMIGQFPSALETPDRLAYNLLVLRRYGVSDDYLRDFHKNVNAITLTDLNAAIKRNVDASRFRVVAYADQAQVGEALKTVGTWTVEEAK